MSVALALRSLRALEASTQTSFCLLQCLVADGFANSRGPDASGLRLVRNTARYAIASHPTTDMIYPYNNANMTRWNHDELPVQLDLPGQSQPMGYCDGTDEDERELRAQAEDEGVNNLRIQKKQLKSGRQIWTLGDPPVGDDEV